MTDARNIAAVHQEVECLRMRLDKAAVRLDALDGTIATLIARVTAMELALAQVRVTQMGRGSSSGH